MYVYPTLPPDFLRRLREIEESVTALSRDVEAWSGQSDSVSPSGAEQREAVAFVDRLVAFANQRALKTQGWSYFLIWYARRHLKKDITTYDILRSRLGPVELIDLDLAIEKGWANISKGASVKNVACRLAKEFRDTLSRHERKKWSKWILTLTPPLAWWLRPRTSAAAIGVAAAAGALLLLPRHLPHENHDRSGQGPSDNHVSAAGSDLDSDRFGTNGPREPNVAASHTQENNDLAPPPSSAFPAPTTDTVVSHRTDAGGDGDLEKRLAGADPFLRKHRLLKTAVSELSVKNFLKAESLFKEALGADYAYDPIILSGHERDAVDLLLTDVVVTNGSAGINIMCSIDNVDIGRIRSTITGSDIRRCQDVSARSYLMEALSGAGKWHEATEQAISYYNDYWNIERHCTLAWRIVIFSEFSEIDNATTANYFREVARYCTADRYSGDNVKYAYPRMFQVLSKTADGRGQLSDICQNPNNKIRLMYSDKDLVTTACTFSGLPN